MEAHCPGGQDSKAAPCKGETQWCKSTSGLSCFISIEAMHLFEAQDKLEHYQHGTHCVGQYLYGEESRDTYK